MSEFTLPFLILAGLAILIFFAANKNINHVTANHIRILGIENKSLVKTPTLFLIKILYGGGLLLVSAFLLYFVMTA